jgi:uncharacterized protein (DUF58 family)
MQSAFANWFPGFKPGAGVPETARLTDPILSARAIHALADEVAQLGDKIGVNPKASDARKQGEQTSRYLGSGMEYEESRAYQPGDDVRHLNWRLMARTGQAYTKLFQEERQESWTVIVDQRQSMRFGTQSRLKVVQAARAAGLFAWLAEQNARPLEGVALAEGARTSPIFEGRGTFERFMEFVSVPCPPLRNVTESRLSDELLACLNRLQSGSRLVILSDFADLDDASLRVLAALSEKVMVQAVLLEDPVERNLPKLPGLKLQSLNGGFELDHLSERQHHSYQQWAQHYFDEKIHRLAGLGISAVSLSTVDSLAHLTEALGEQYG